MLIVTSIMYTCDVKHRGSAITSARIWDQNFSLWWTWSPVLWDVMLCILVQRYFPSVSWS